MNTKWATKFLLNKIRLSLPPMSQTEKIALEAGSVWWDQQIMSGKPNWNLLFSTPAPSLTEEERDFIENEVNQACEMVNEWNINHDHNELPDHIWSFIKEKGFLGMIIPKKIRRFGIFSICSITNPNKTCYSKLCFIGNGDGSKLSWPW
jgi:alkylation response protein AidB-like acyl-CoA dehydrogenase